MDLDFGWPVKKSKKGTANIVEKSRFFNFPGGDPGNFDKKSVFGHFEGHFDGDWSGNQ